MDWIKQSLILLVFAIGLLEFCSGDADSKLQTAQQFEQCVVGNISESTVFSEEDLLRVYKIVLETGVRMQKLRADPTNATNARTMLRLFTAALAYLVSESDPSNRSEREEACISALETCSGLLPENIGSELVNEIRKIFESMDSGKTMESSGEHSRRKIPTSSGQKEQHLKESTEKIPSDDLKTKTRSKRAFPSAFGIPDTTVQLQSNPSFESVIASVLLKSTSFTDTFNIGLSQSDAIFYSGGMITASLAGYSYDIIDEAFNSVTNAVSTIRFMPRPEDFAFAIARSIASVLGSRGLLPFADAVIIGNALVFKLDSMLETNPSVPFSPNFGMPISSSGWGTAGSVLSGSEVPVPGNPDFIAPSFTTFNFQNDQAQFQSSLSYFLSQSGAISTAFCSGSLPNLFNVINSALSDYGFPISSAAATVIVDSFSGLPDAAACTQYADVISEIISNIFQNNDLLQTADPQAIANQIAFNINSNSDVGNNPSQNPQNFAPQEFGGFQLNPSFSDFTFPEVQVPPLNPEVSSAGNPNTEISSSVPNTQFNQQQNPAPSADQVYPAEFQSSGIQPLPPFPVIETPAQPQDFVDQPTPITSDKEEATDYNSELPRSNVQISSQQSDQGLDKPISSSNNTSNPVLQSSTSLNSPMATNQTLEIKSDSLANASIAMDRPIQTSVPLFPPIVLEPGPFISGNSTVNMESKSEVKNVSANNYATPTVVEEIKEPEMTTAAPTSTDSLRSTSVSILETSTTPDPYVDALDDILLDPGKFSDLLTDDIYKSLKAMNLTSPKEEKQPNLPKAATNSKKGSSGASTDGETGAEPLTNSKVPSQPDVNPKGKSNVDDTNLKTKTSTSEKASSGNGDKDSAKMEKKVFEIDPSVRDSIAEISSIAAASINFIRSGRFHLNGLCVRLNELALIVDIPPLDSCSELATVDYLLNVLNAVALAVTG